MSLFLRICISVPLRCTLIPPHLVFLFAPSLSFSLPYSRFPRVTLPASRPLLLLLEGDAFFCRRRLHGGGPRSLEMPEWKNSLLVSEVSFHGSYGSACPECATYAFRGILWPSIMLTPKPNGSDGDHRWIGWHDGSRISESLHLRTATLTHLHHPYAGENVRLRMAYAITRAPAREMQTWRCRTFSKSLLRSILRNRITR